MVASRDLQKWPNGIILSYYQKFPCGHVVPVFSKQQYRVSAGSVRPDPIGGINHGEWKVTEETKELRDRVLETGCIKCVEPVEPLDYEHKGRGGFLKNFRERI